MTVIAQILANRNMTQIDLCRMADFYASNASRLVNGTVKAGPTVRARTAAALGVPEEELFDGRGWALEADAA